MENKKFNINIKAEDDELIDLFDNFPKMSNNGIMGGPYPNGVDNGVDNWNHDFEELIRIMKNQKRRKKLKRIMKNISGFI